MGRIKNTAVKTLAKDLIMEHGKIFTDDFEKNKEALKAVKEIKSKRVRNILVGYITKEMKRVKKSGI